jgi:hypothetical protein
MIIAKKIKKCPCQILGQGHFLEEQIIHSKASGQYWDNYWPELKPQY